jgi:hypothetical protein
MPLPILILGPQAVPKIHPQSLKTGWANILVILKVLLIRVPRLLEHCSRPKQQGQHPHYYLLVEG